MFQSTLETQIRIKIIFKIVLILFKINTVKIFSLLQKLNIKKKKKDKKMKKREKVL